MADAASLGPSTMCWSLVFDLWRKPPSPWQSLGMFGKDATPKSLTPLIYRSLKLFVVALKTFSFRLVEVKTAPLVLPCSLVVTIMTLPELYISVSPYNPHKCNMLLCCLPGCWYDKVQVGVSPR
jgi:hypothetical protein